MLRDRNVRNNYFFVNEEKDGTLSKYGLGLPPIDPPKLTPSEQIFIDEAYKAVAIVDDVPRCRAESG